MSPRSLLPPPAALHSTLSKPSRPLIPSIPSMPNTSSRPYPLNSAARPSPWDSIDLANVEVVDLTEPSSQEPSAARRRAPSPTAHERPSKKAKGKHPQKYVALDDDDEESQDGFESEDPEPTGGMPLPLPSESGSLSDVKCVICLDSPTDLASTPCGTPPSPPPSFKLSSMC
jgi:hypothetical protein